MKSGKVEPKIAHKVILTLTAFFLKVLSKMTMARIVNTKKIIPSVIPKAAGILF